MLEAQLASYRRSNILQWRRKITVIIWISRHKEVQADQSYLTIRVVRHNAIVDWMCWCPFYNRPGQTLNRPSSMQTKGPRIFLAWISQSSLPHPTSSEEEGRLWRISTSYFRESFGPQGRMFGEESRRAEDPYKGHERRSIVQGPNPRGSRTGEPKERPSHFRVP